MKKFKTLGLILFCAAMLTVLCSCSEAEEISDTQPMASLETEAPTTICAEGIHSWGEVTYTWINDNTACIAKRVCTVASCAVVEKEVVQAVNQTATDESGEPKENIKTAVFENQDFETQIESQSIEGVEAAFVVSDAAGAAGETVTVTIDVHNNPGIIAAALEIHYDQSKLKLLSSEDGMLLPDPTFSADVKQYPYYLSWNDALADSNNTTNGTLVKLTFEIIEGSGGQTEVSVTYHPGNVFDWDLNDVFFLTVPGIITIS